MEQFAALRQAARDGETDNERVLRELGNMPVINTKEKGSELDIPLFQTISSQSLVSKAQLGVTDDERAYYNAIRTTKRGDDALVEHLDQKVAKTKRARTRESSNYAGVQISARNAEFNARRQKQLH